MKQFHIIPCLALLALVFSCDDIKAPGVDKKIDTHSEVSVEKLTGMAQSPALKMTADGKFYLEQAAENSIKAAVNTSNTNTLKGNITIDGSGLPEVGKPVEGSSENSGIFIVVDNPAPETVSFSATAVIDDKPVTLPPTTVKDGKTIAFITNTSNPDKIEYETPVLIPDTATEPLSNGIDLIDLSDITIAPTKPAPAALMGVYEMTVSAKYYTSLSFPAGAKLHLSPTFSDLNINLDRVNYPLSEYDIHMTIESTIPFDLKVGVSSEDGISGSTDDIVKAGAVGNPVKSSIVVHVIDKSGHNVSAISSATFSIDMIAGNNAYLGKGQSLKIDTEKLTIQKP